MTETAPNNTGRKRAFSLNEVRLIGRLGKDPECRTTDSGTPVANLSLATSESWTDDNQTDHERTAWHRVVAWGKLAEICQEYLAKGRLVYVAGYIRYREYAGKDGVSRQVAEIVAKTVQVLDTLRQEDQAADARKAA